jgi:hypothetical protein
MEIETLHLWADLCRVKAISIPGYLIRNWPALSPVRPLFSRRNLSIVKDNMVVPIIELLGQGCLKYSNLCLCNLHSVA